MNFDKFTATGPIELSPHKPGGVFRHNISILETFPYYVDTMPPKISSPATRFRRDVCWNPYIAKELALRQIGICTVCSRALGSYRLVVHHLDYAHECSWGDSLILLVGKRRRSIPDCLACRIESDHRFQMCRRRLQLLHRRCHVELHKGRKTLRPVT